jgi:hypothetical protein
MIRPLTFICLLGAFGSGLYLYTEKHRAILLDREIGRAIHGTEAARQRTGLLRAEWALLNDPGRLQDMADKYLALKPMAPGQFVQLADLSTRLPPPVAPTPAAADDTADGDAAPPVVPVAPVPDVPAVVASAEPVKPAPPHVPAKQLARATPKRSSRPTSVASRDPLPQESPLTHGTPLPLAGLPPSSARVMSAMARPMRPASRPAVITAYPAAIGAAPYMGTAYVGSALASGSSLPPPVPLR